MHEDILPSFISWWKKYGKMYRVWFGNQPTIILSDADVIKQILNRDIDVEFFCKGIWLHHYLNPRLRK
jgi:hypothetical protein